MYDLAMIALNSPESGKLVCSLVCACVSVCMHACIAWLRVCVFVTCCLVTEISKTISGNTSG